MTDREVICELAALLREALDRLTASPDNETFSYRCIDYLAIVDSWRRA